MAQGNRLVDGDELGGDRVRLRLQLFERGVADLPLELGDDDRELTDLAVGGRTVQLRIVHEAASFLLRLCRGSAGSGLCLVRVIIRPAHGTTTTDGQSMSQLGRHAGDARLPDGTPVLLELQAPVNHEIGRASGRERVRQYANISGVALQLK